MSHGVGSESRQVQHHRYESEVAVSVTGRNQILNSECRFEQQRLDFDLEIAADGLVRELEIRIQI